MADTESSHPAAHRRRRQKRPPTIQEAQLPRLELAASDTENEHSDDSAGEKEAKRQRSEPTTPVSTSSRHPWECDAIMGITRVGPKEAERFEEDLDSTEYHDATEEPARKDKKGGLEDPQLLPKPGGISGGFGSSSLKECIELLDATVRNSPAPLDSGVGQEPTVLATWKVGQNVYRLMVVQVNHAIARTACRSCRINFADLLILCAHFQVDLMGGDFSALSYRYCRSGSQQIAASLQDSSLAVMLRRFDEGINTQHRGIFDNHPEYQFRCDLYMTYHDEHIEEYRLMRNATLDEVTDAAGESTKILRLQRALQEFDENFDVIGLINFNWDHTVSKPLSIDNRYQREPQSKSTIIKNKHASRYLAGQEKMCRLSGMAQRITPELLQLRQRDQDTHRVLKVALQPWATLAGMKSLIEFGARDVLGETYFRADNFCKVYHDNLEYRRNVRQLALDCAESHGDGPIVPVIGMDRVFYQRPSPRTLAQLNYGLLSGSSNSLSRSALDTLPGSTGGVVLRNRFSVLGREAGYSETVDGDHSDFGIGYGVYRR